MTHHVLITAADLTALQEQIARQSDQFEAARNALKALRLAETREG